MYLGIDLGTSNSVVVGLVDDVPQLFKTADGADCLPSVIYFDKRGHRLYGRRAYDMAVISPENVASGFKRLLGTATPIQIAGAELSTSPEDCATEILRQLLTQAFTETGETNIEGAVITVPAAFNQMQSEATLRAAKMAGLGRVVLLPEPIAAAIAAQEGQRRTGQFLVYDLGGGTFDLALARSDAGEITILGHRGINMLGGRDFDRLLVNQIVRPWLQANFDLPEGFQRDPAYRRLIRIAQLAAEKAKIDLSSSNNASIFAADDEVRLSDLSGQDIFIDVRITRADYEALISDAIAQTVAIAKELLEELKLETSDIDRIVFVGGPSKTPIVRQMVSEQLGIAADIKLDSMTAVATGAAYYAALKDWDDVPALLPSTDNTALKSAASSAPLEATPAAMQAAGKSGNKQHVTIPATQTIAVKVLEKADGHTNILHTILERGTVLPASGTQNFRAARSLHSGENAYLSFELFQLEYTERIDLNLCVGVFRLGGADLPQGYTIKVGDVLVFNWQMSDSGLLTATVQLPDGTVLATPRFYSPQAGEMSFGGAVGIAFAEAVLRHASEEWGDLAAALGPDGGRELDLLRHRIDEQRDALSDALGDPEGVRRVSEEARFIRQDLGRLSKRHMRSVLARRLGKLTTIYNRVASPFAQDNEQKSFEHNVAQVRAAMASDAANQSELYYQAERQLEELRLQFFAIAWRDPNYVTMWFRRLCSESYLFPQEDEFYRMVEAGEHALANGQMVVLAQIVDEMLNARVTLAASEIASDPATILRA